MNIKRRTIVMTVMALAIAATTILTTPVSAQAAKKTTVVSTAAKVKALPQVKQNGGVLPREIYEYEVYSQYPDLKAAFGNNKAAYYNHYLTYGIKEGRTASSQFNVLDYKNRYADLQAAFGEDLIAYIGHYLSYGLKEGRAAIGGASAAVSTQTPASAATVSVPSAPAAPAPNTVQTPSAPATPVPNPTQTPTTPQKETAEPVKKDEPRFEKELAMQTLRDINAYRAEVGAEPLMWSEDIYERAEIRAKELVTLFEHTRPDGTSCSTAMEGLPAEYQLCGGEIIAIVYDGTTAAEAWYSSKPHRSNMLWDRAYHAAVGIYYEDGAYYCVTLFAISTTQYRYSDCYELDSWTLTDGSTITAREYDRLEWDHKRAIDKHFDEDGKYIYYGAEDEAEFFELHRRYREATQCYLAALGY